MVYLPECIIGYIEIETVVSLSILEIRILGSSSYVGKFHHSATTTTKHLIYIYTHKYTLVGYMIVSIVVNQSRDQVYKAKVVIPSKHVATGKIINI